MASMSLIGALSAIPFGVLTVCALARRDKNRHQEHQNLFV